MGLAPEGAGQQVSWLAVNKWPLPSQWADEQRPGQLAQAGSGAPGGP